MQDSLAEKQIRASKQPTKSTRAKSKTKRTTNKEQRLTSTTMKLIKAAIFISLSLAGTAAAPASSGRLCGIKKEYKESDSSAVTIAHSRELSSILETILVNKGISGSWQQACVQPRGGYYACGASVKVDDDSYLIDGLNLKFCSLLNWDGNQFTETIYSGVMGTFGDYTMYPQGSFLNGIDFQTDTIMDIGLVVCVSSARITRLEMQELSPCLMP